MSDFAPSMWIQRLREHLETRGSFRLDDAPSLGLTEIQARAASTGLRYSGEAKAVVDDNGTVTVYARRPGEEAERFPEPDPVAISANEWWNEPATEKQKMYLNRLGYLKSYRDKFAGEMTKKEAIKAINQMKRGSGQRAAKLRANHMK